MESGQILTSESLKVLSDEEFKEFKIAHNFYLNEFNLKEWNCLYLLSGEDVENCHAKTFYNFQGKAATIKLNPIWPEHIPFSLEKLRGTAKHEVIHLMTARLYILTTRRYVSLDEVDEAEEGLVRILDNLL